MAKGTLTVKANGYWFTAGGEKGSFGYYPHLKDSKGYPLYPDTQVHGDLKMAARWLANLNGNHEGELIDKLFGKDEGGISPSQLRISDLMLSQDDRQKHRPENLFQIKPRISIDDQKGTVERGMLAYRETAWLNGLTLQAKIYIGYTTSRNELQRACRLVEDAAQFVSGFGGNRSRGYGRGKVQVRFEPFQEAVGSNSPKMVSEGEILYFARALVNFRNKGVSQRSSMQVNTQDHIAAHQFKGWFIRTYHRLFGEWPTDSQMQTIHFPSLYPAFKAGGKYELAYPAPASTVKFETSDRIQDRYGAEKGERQPSADDGKPKPLGPGWYVTGGASPRAFEIKAEKRFRNRMDGDFITEEKGLVVQELIPAATLFGGRVAIADSRDEFTGRAGYILFNIMPEINGCLFETRIESTHNEDPASTGAYLVTDPVIYSGSPPGTNEQIRLSVSRRYSTVWKRPRRNRINIAPGSIVHAQVPHRTTAWEGFKQMLSKVGPTGPAKPGKPEKQVKDRPEWIDGLVSRTGVIEMTRAQSGLLRDLLHPEMTQQIASDLLKSRLKKHERGGTENEKHLAKLDNACLDCLQGANGLKQLQKFLQFYLEEVALSRWEIRQK